MGVVLAAGAGLRPGCSRVCPLGAGGSLGSEQSRLALIVSWPPAGKSHQSSVPDLEWSSHFKVAPLHSTPNPFLHPALHTDRSWIRDCQGGG